MSGWVGLGALALVFVAGPVAELSFGATRLVDSDYSAMLVYVAGVALLVPNPASLAAFGVLAIGLDLHVRLVEEPYLAATHGSSYASYAAQVGRFVPGVGKLTG